MMKKIVICWFLLLTAIGLRAQVNPYEDLGIETKVLTLSNGKYEEFFDLDSIQQIGTILYNINTGEVIGEVEGNEKYYIPKFAPSRFISPDPIAEDFPWIDPYSYVLNNPLKWVDPTGMAPESPDWGWERRWNKETKQYDYKIVNDVGGNDFDILTTTTGSFLGGDLSSSQSILVNETGGARLSDDMPGMWGGDIATGQATALDISDFIPQKGAAKGMVAMAAGFFGKKMAAKGSGLVAKGLGSTGRTTAANLTEQLAMKEIMSNPAALGKAIPKMKPLSDPRWKGWIKMSNRNAHGVEIHFNAQFKNGKMINVDDFKFIGQ